RGGGGPGGAGGGRCARRARGGGPRGAPHNPPPPRPYAALNGGPQFSFTEAVSLQVECDDQQEIDELWAKLTADGGQAGPCGWLKDRYGFSWQITPRVLLDLIADPDRAKAGRVMAAMMSMGKIEIRPLLAAAEG
ncbi:VOC family protein, partial [Kitasatospora sp. NPDC059722]|uniref:VOC family protein n=1 Tax=Kitasatospora sp. NPDC059722 TaxID=3346925 RepID=UPI0036B1FEB5